MRSFSTFLLIFMGLVSHLGYAHEKTVLGVLPIFYQILRDLSPQEISVQLLEKFPSDPHYFILTPSHLHQIQQADFVFGPTEWQHKLHLYAKIAKGIESVAHDQESHQSLGFLYELISDKPLKTDRDLKEKLQELSHEWMSFSGMKLLYRVAKDSLIDLVPEKKEEISLKYFNIIQTIEDLEKAFSQKKLPKQSIFYHNDFWILQEELHVNLGPSLYGCDDESLSPEDLILLSTKTDEYAFFIADAQMNHDSLRKIFDYMKTPLTLKTIHPLGQIRLSGPEWLETQLEAVYAILP